MYSYVNKNMAETATNYNTYKSMPMNHHPSQFEPACYSDEYMNNIYNSSTQDPSTSNRESQIPLLYPSSNNNTDHNSYVNPDFNNHPSSNAPFDSRFR